MCGFVGFYDETNCFETAIPVLENMMDAMAHRGPDDTGCFVEAPVALGFRRLSIIDLESGNQPMMNKEKDLVLVFNGEIYNYQLLREGLIAKGYHFRTKTDSEVLLHGYAEYGEELPRRLRGMFSFVIWDKKRQRLFGARDAFGIKPFYYAKMGDAFLFASEIKSFFPHPAFEKRFNHRLLPAYLSFQYTPPGKETFFEGVYKLPPAHSFIWEKGTMTVAAYEELQFEEDSGTGKNVPAEQWTDRIEDVIADSVAAHKISDVEVCSFLSGGVDSSYIAAIANVKKTFTVGFDIAGGAYSELDCARALSEKIGAENYRKLIEADEYWDAVRQVQYHMDEPVADPSAVALYFLCQLASRHCKVVLSGEGADEIFGGYNFYREPLVFPVYDKLPTAWRRWIGQVAAKLPAHQGLNFLVRRSESIENRYIGNAYIFTPQEAKVLLTVHPEAPVLTEYTRPFYDRMGNKDDATRMQTLDLHCWLTGDILQKADKMSMAHSLELRVPYLDREVWTVAKMLPSRERTTRKETKVAFRRAAGRHLPESWASRKKLGFPVPIRVWLREEKYYALVKKAFTSETAARFFHTEQLLKILDDHKKGVCDYSRKIYTIYAFLIWYGKFFEEDGHI